MKIPHEGGWTFEEQSIAGAFDDHVREQLPWYDLATGVVAHIIRHYLPVGGTLYDIGASTGNITKAVRQTLKNRNAKTFAVEPSQEMIDLYKGEGEIIKSRAEDVEFQPFDVAVLFLSLMFVPVASRTSLLCRLTGNLNPGGCIIVFDKQQPTTGYLSTVLYRLTLAGKVATGTDANDIIKKELSLAGVQIPVLAQSGWRQIFQFGDFAGWIIEKG